MKKILLVYVLVPAIVCGVVTATRVWLELHDPGHALTKVLSATVLALVWTVLTPILLLRSGASLWQMLVATFSFFLLFRLPIGWAYAAAWAGKWTVEGTTDPVRYVANIRDQSAALEAPSILTVFSRTTFLPIGFGLVLVLIVWTIAWAVGFRGKRPFAGAVPSSAGASP